MIKINIKPQLLTLLLCGAWAANAQNQKVKTQPLEERFKTELATNIGYKAFVYQVDASGFGYIVASDKKIIIEQPFIPSAKGFVRFRNQVQASKIGALVVSKLQNNIFPPQITKHELDSLKINTKPKK